MQVKPSDDHFFFKKNKLQENSPEFVASEKSWMSVAVTFSPENKGQNALLCASLMAFPAGFPGKLPFWSKRSLFLNHLLQLLSL